MEEGTAISIFDHFEPYLGWIWIQSGTFTP